MKYYDIPNEKFNLYGLKHDKTNGFLRVPVELSKKVSKGVAKFGMHTSGGRIRFCTNSKHFELIVEYNDFYNMPHMALSGSSGFVLIKEDSFYKKATILTPQFTDDKGFKKAIELENNGKMADYTLFFPLYNNVQKLMIGLDDNAVIENGIPYREILPVLYYGSSITQGACASRPDKNYPSLINKWNDIDFINLGFSESGKAEDLIVDYLSNINCSVFVCDYDYNAPNVEYLKSTHKRLYVNYRKKRPVTPILFISRANTKFDWCEQRVAIIKKTFDYAKSLGDENVYFLDGGTIYCGEDSDCCLVDEVHPNDIGYYYYAKAVYTKLKEINKSFE